jgi:hypothetical protein
MYHNWQICFLCASFTPLPQKRRVFIWHQLQTVNSCKGNVQLINSKKHHSIHFRAFSLYLHCWSWNFSDQIRLGLWLVPTHPWHCSCKIFISALPFYVTHSGLKLKSASWLLSCESVSHIRWFWRQCSSLLCISLVSVLCSVTCGIGSFITTLFSADISL